MTLNEPRLNPLSDEELNEEQQEVLKNQQMRGSVPNVFRTIAHHPKLAKRWMVFATHILNKTTLSPREREIAILRAGYLAGSEYEWGQHVVIGKAAGLSLEEIKGIRVGATADCWSEHEKFVIRAADELHADVIISDDTWQGLLQTYSNEQVLDLIFTCGQYRMLAGALNSLGVPLDDDIEGFDVP